MMLVFDVGNTNTVLGVFDGEQLVAHWRVSTTRARTADEYGILLNNLFQIEQLRLKDIKSVVMSSVVPHLMHILKEMSQGYLQLTPLVVGPGIKTGLPIKMDHPREVGADRIVNAMAAYHMYGGPVIIVDFGTATTFCAVSQRGEYIGGAIAPGIGISTEALFAKAAKLPRVEMKRPPAVLGKNTVHGLQSGIVFGYAGLVDSIVSRMIKEIGQCQVVATGGMAKLIDSESTTINLVQPLLTLYGLKLIYQRNKE